MVTVGSSPTSISYNVVAVRNGEWDTHRIDMQRSIDVNGESAYSDLQGGSGRNT